MAGDDENGEGVLHPREALRLIEEQRGQVRRRLQPDPLFMYVPWGVAWTIGFGVLFLRLGLTGEPYVPIPSGVATGILLAAMAVAMAVTVFLGLRTGISVRGVSQDRGMMYGISWSVAFFTSGTIASRFVAVGRLDDREAGLLWSALSLLVIGVLYMAGGAVWRHWTMFFIGVGILAVNIVGTMAGPGWHALLTTVCCGGGFIVAGLVEHRRWRKAGA
ncbi:hypothetical protein HNP84_001716 [Thermocatellispora tengchongensis]|uniref:Uncharacterized protein n=1 Tax=Thermocatellispora tengchongensis TaxID=1073253 RepID=A0A840P243_9ACTN|nr:transporter [Thermocatellispora tengchongensis]MBB5132003.1 hypothetical protein [Thermocatellispora tengchongensis]